MKFPSIPSLLNIQGGKELGNYLIVLILGEGHDLPQVFGLTSSHHLIKDVIMLVLHISPIYQLNDSHQLVLGNYGRLIEVLLKSGIESVVN
jgi:hypothetical protein